MSPESCPNCGADVPRGARVCPGCGADERTGWSEEADLDRLGIAETEDFDHDDFVRRELEGRPRHPYRTWVWVVAALLLAALLAGWLF